MDANQPKQDAPRPPYKRWYDKQQTVSKSVKLLQTFPIEYQEVLADTMIRLAKKHCRAEELMADIKAQGPEKVLSIFKAKSKNRDYDQNETVHKAMIYLYILPDEGRIFIAGQVIIVVGHLFEYFTICRETSQSASREVVQSLSNAFVQGQLQDTVEHLARFFPSMTLPNGPTVQSIRARIAQNGARPNGDESSRSGGGWSNPSLIGARPPTPITRTTPEKWAGWLSDTQAEEAQAPETESAFEPVATGSSPVEDADNNKPDAQKDETLAQDKRGMKIRLDKFDL